MTGMGCSRIVCEDASNSSIPACSLSAADAFGRGRTRQSKRRRGQRWKNRSAAQYVLL